MPEPLSEARCTPLPASNSRQRPAESASVMSTVSLLKAIRFERSPATVTKLPRPSVDLEKKVLALLCDHFGLLCCIGFVSP